MKRSHCVQARRGSRSARSKASAPSDATAASDDQSGRAGATRLIKHGVTFDQVIEAIEKNNRNVGGGYLRRGSQMILVHGIGRTVDRDQVKAIQIASKDGVPIRLGDVADVEIRARVVVSLADGIDDKCAVIVPIPEGAGFIL